MIEPGSNPPPFVLREEILHVPGSRPSHRIVVMPGNYLQGTAGATVSCPANRPEPRVLVKRHHVQSRRGNDWVVRMK